MIARPDQRSPEALAYRHLYKTPQWRTRRLRQLQSKPLCEWCEDRGQTVAATVAHHSEPHKGDRHKFFHGELTSLCADCHDREAQQMERLGYSKAIGLDGWPTDAAHPANRP